MSFFYINTGYFRVKPVHNFKLFLLIKTFLIKTKEVHNYFIKLLIFDYHTIKVD